MKPYEIIKKNSKIQENIISFFVVEKDFKFMGLPLIKNSLVYYNGKGKISVNMIEFSMFQSSNYPYLLLETVSEDDNDNYIVEKVSNCNREITMLKIGWRGIWHDNHFDKWSGSFSDYKERINNSPKLKLNNIEFSSICYEYDIYKQTLIYFINTKPVEININNKKVNLPELLEISFSNNSYSIIPINKQINYHNIKMQGVLFLSEDGFLEGESAEDFDVKINGHSKLSIIKITKGFPIKVSNSGSASIKLLNEQKHVIETLKISKL